MVMPRAAIVIDNTPRNLMGAYQPARCTSAPLRGLGRQFACRLWVLSVVLLISMARAGVAGAQVHVTESNKTADGARSFGSPDPLRLATLQSLPKYIHLLVLRTFYDTFYLCHRRCCFFFGERHRFCFFGCHFGGPWPQGNHAQAGSIHQR